MSWPFGPKRGPADWLWFMLQLRLGISAAYELRTADLFCTIAPRAAIAAGSFCCASAIASCKLIRLSPASEAVCAASEAGRAMSIRNFFISCTRPVWANVGGGGKHGERNLHERACRGGPAALWS